MARFDSREGATMQRRGDEDEVSGMTTRRLLLTTVALIVLCLSGAVAQYAGPKLEGTALLRSGEMISGVVLTVQLGILDGAEIGSSLKDGGYISVAAADGQRDVKATDIASIDVEWANTGEADAPKWTISTLTIVTTAGETIVGQPTWMVHASNVNIELPDGTRKRAYFFPVGGTSFTADDLLTKLTLGVAVPVTGTVTPVETPATDLPPATDAPATDAPATDAPATDAPATDAPATDAPATDAPATDAPATDAPATDAPATDAPATDAPAATEVVTIEPVTPPAADTPPVVETPTVTVTPPPVVTALPENAVFAAGEPAIIVFEVINPETGNPMKIKFLLVPLPAE